MVGNFCWSGIFVVAEIFVGREFLARIFGWSFWGFLFCLLRSQKIFGGWGFLGFLSVGGF